MLRAFLLRWHRRLALGFGALLLLQFLTGILLVFREELVAIGLPPAADDGSTTAFATLENAVRSAHPSARLLAVQFPSAATRDYLFRLADPLEGTLTLAMDPHEPNPHPLGNIGRAIEWVRGFHEDLLLGAAGRWVVSLNALALLILIGTGWKLWWQGVARLASSLRVPLHGSMRIKLLCWHRTFGSLVGLLMLPSIVTGFMLAIGAFLPSWTPNVAPPSLRAESSDARLALARSLFPGLAIREIRFDAATGGLKRVVLREPGAGLHAPITDISFDSVTGQIVSIVDPNRLGGYDRFAAWSFPIHSGQAGGVVARMALLATGIAVAILASLGLALWFVRRVPRTVPANQFVRR